MRLFRRLTKEEFKDRLEKKYPISVKFYEEGEKVEPFEGTKEELETKLGKPVRLLWVAGEVVKHIPEHYELLGRLHATHLVDAKVIGYDKNKEPIYKGKPTIAGEE